MVIVTTYALGGQQPSLRLSMPNFSVSDRLDGERHWPTGSKKTTPSHFEVRPPLRTSIIHISTYTTFQCNIIPSLTST